MTTNSTTLDATTTTVDSEADEAEALVCECPNCGDMFSEDNAPSNAVIVGRNGYRWSRATWCDDCQSRSTVYVEDCGEYCDESVVGDFFYFWESDCEWHSDPEPEPDDEETDGDSLLNYSTDIMDVLGWPRGLKPDALCFGVELEMEAKGSNYANDIVSLLGGSDGTKTGRAILKHDGSLREGRGVELVTLPDTLEGHQSGYWHKLLDSRLQRAAQSGAGTTNCGIHVHINRAALSPLTVGKLVVFLNNPANDAFVTTVAQRRSGGYCQRDERKAKVTQAYRPREISDDYYSRPSNTRYDIINVTGGSTVEIRMFRGNLRPERVLKNVEFCHALVMFCESAGIAQAASYSLFLAWLEKHRKAYPNLVGFLREHDYMAKPVVRGAVLEIPTQAEV